MTEMGSCISRLGDLGIRFHLVMTQQSGNQKTHIYLLSGDPWDDNLLMKINKEIRGDAEDSFQVVSPVELVYFQGPHFGDRYGIFYSALSILERHQIHVLLAGCSGSAIYLVLPQAGIEKSRPILAEAFEVP